MVGKRMSAQQSSSVSHALVAVFNDLETAKSVVEQLHASGFDLGRIQLVTGNGTGEFPELETPPGGPTTTSSIASGAMRGAKMGLAAGSGFGIVASVLTASPALLFGALIYGGVTGALVGGIGGADDADIDDSVNLPTREEYQEMLDGGDNLVVVYGTHAELQRAHGLMEHDPDAVTHVHRVHGHLFHEHPRHPHHGDEQKPPR
jgi:hypothetical protein